MEEKTCSGDACEIDYDAIAAERANPELQPIDYDGYGSTVRETGV